MTPKRFKEIRAFGGFQKIPSGRKLHRSEIFGDRKRFLNVYPVIFLEIPFGFRVGEVGTKILYRSLVAML